MGCVLGHAHQPAGSPHDPQNGCTRIWVMLLRGAWDAPGRLRASPGCGRHLVKPLEICASGDVPGIYLFL